MKSAHSTSLASNDKSGRSEQFRPAYHYTPERNWMNDPNGLVWFDGEYHLYYQYNPHGNEWGHMSWGHSVSIDLLHWRELLLAIPEGEGMIFSGSAIVDHVNISGLGDGNDPPILAYYTEHLSDPIRIERQCVAYSRDKGRTFKQYIGNPVIDIGLEQFRDPKVLYHESSKAWIMVVPLSLEHCVHFYRSTNLLDWEYASSFGPRGYIGGKWECTDLLFIHAEDGDVGGRWVLKIDVDDGAVGGGSGSQYFVGDFDGYRFEIDKERGSDRGLFVDYGPDFYASQSWSNLPERHDGHILIGWMSNQQSGHFYPTSPWRGVMSLPRSLYLFEERGELRLGQRPIAEIERLRGCALSTAEFSLDKGLSSQLATNLQTHEVQTALTLSPDAIVRLSVKDHNGPLVSIIFDRANGQIHFERAQASIDETIAFGRRSQTEMFDEGTISLRIFLDSSTLEIFLMGGRRVFSSCVFPDGDMTLSLECSEGTAHVSGGRVWPLARTI